MKWEYKSVMIKVAEEELDTRLDAYGEVGWEVYYVSDKGTISEFSSKGNQLHKFVVQMKRTL